MEGVKVLIAVCRMQMEGFKVLYMSALDEVVHRMQAFDERRAANVTPPLPPLRHSHGRRAAPPPLRGTDLA